MGMTSGDVLTLVDRYSQKDMHEQSRMSMALLNESIIKIHDGKTERGKVNVKSGRVDSHKYVNDYDAIPLGGSRKRGELFYGPKAQLETLSFGEVAFQITTNPKEAIDHVLDEIKSGRDQMNGALNRAIIRSHFGGPVAAMDDTDLTCELEDWKHFEEGMAVEIVDAAGVVKVAKIVIADVERLANGNATVTFYTAPGVAVATTDRFQFVGMSSTGKMVGLHDMCDPDEDLYDEDANFKAKHPQWKGKTFTESSCTAAVIKSVIDKIETRSQKGHNITHMIGSTEQRTAIIDGQADRVQWTGVKRDDYGKTQAMVDGKPFIVDNDSVPKTLLLFCKKDYELHRFWDFKARVENGEGNGRGALLINRDTYSRDLQMHGAFQGRVKTRRSSGRIVGLNT